jgi:hypothetical protein
MGRLFSRSLRNVARTLAALALAAATATLSGATPGPADLDACVDASLARRGLVPAVRCEDAVFLRRVFLDVLGTLPTADEATAFLADPAPDKRARLVSLLLERPEFADYWAMKWADILRVKAEFPVNLWPNAAQAYHRWIRTTIRDRWPYDRFVRELLTASGSNFRVGPVNFYRALQSRSPEAAADAVGLILLGERVASWPVERRAGLAAFFGSLRYKPSGEWKEEIVIFDPTGLPREARFPDGTRIRLEADRDPRGVFADWLTAPDNPWLARTAANRLWFWLFGRGLIHEPDDARADNPPSDPALLALLERALRDAGFDLGALFTLILNSETYQRSAATADGAPVPPDSFAACTVRRLDAEVIIDAINRITGTSETYSSAIPEPFTYVPESQRAIALEDGSITSSFLELFGRPPRDTGQLAERANASSAGQRLHLLNSSHIRRKLEQGPALQELLRGAIGADAVIERLYLTILSRPPSADERGAVRDYARAARLRPREVAIDVAWALLNTTEFLCRH